MRGPSETRAPRICQEYVFLEDTEATLCEQPAKVSQCPVISSSSKDNVQEICRKFRFVTDFLNLFSVSSCLRGESLLFHSFIRYLPAPLEQRVKDSAGVRRKSRFNHWTLHSRAVTFRAVVAEASMNSEGSADGRAARSYPQ